MAFANHAKLERLPNHVQTILNSLSAFELRTLRAALSPHDHFDFLLLPREIREEIYRLVLLPDSRKIRPSHTGRLPTSLMNVCQQTNLEARRILFTETCCQIVCTSLRYRKDSDDGWYYTGNQDWKWVIFNFRKIRLEITMYPPDGPRSISDFDPSNYIYQVLEVLRTTDHVRIEKAVIKIDIQFIVIASGDAYFELGPSKWPDWASTMISSSVVKSREKIRIGGLNIRITTNADSTPTLKPNATPLTRGWGFSSN